MRFPACLVLIFCWLPVNAEPQAPYAAELEAAKLAAVSDRPEARAEALSALGKLLACPEAAVRNQSLEVLGGLGAEAEPAVAKIQVAMHKGLIGAEGVAALERIGTLRAVGGIAAALSHGEPAVKTAAAAALGRIGEKAQPEVEALIKALEDKAVAPEALKALSQIGGPRALSGMMLPLRGDDHGLKLAAIEALGAWGARAEGAVPLLVRCAEDADARISAAAARALTEIRDAAGEPYGR